MARSLKILSVAYLATLSTAVSNNFYLATTSQLEPTSNSSQLADVSATSLFDPFFQENQLLRLIEPGYLELPIFDFASGRLQTTALGPRGTGPFEYNSAKVKKGLELEFLPSERKKRGNLRLRDGYLLTVNGKAEGWTICEGDLGAATISWRASDESCQSTYIHAVESAPY